MRRILAVLEESTSRKSHTFLTLSRLTYLIYIYIRQTFLASNTAFIQRKELRKDYERQMNQSSQIVFKMWHKKSKDLYLIFSDLKIQRFSSLIWKLKQIENVIFYAYGTPSINMFKYIINENLFDCISRQGLTLGCGLNFT